MISLYPVQNETLVVSLQKSEILRRLSETIDDVRVDFGPPRSLKGWVEGDRFEVTPRQRRQHPFFPSVRGRVESTSKGSLVFMTFVLFPGTRLLITFWTLVLPLAAYGLSHQHDTLIFPALLILFLIIIHIVARANFRLHVKTTQALIHRLLLDEKSPPPRGR